MAPVFKVVTLLSFSLYAAAQGTQFITGACTADTDCASACCGFTSGKCAAPFVANERGEGCGFGDAQPNGGGASNAAQIEGGNANQPANGNGNQNQMQEQGVNATQPAAPATPPPAQAGGNVAAGSQFITGACTSDVDCASACCGFKSGKCAGPVVAQERDGGCGFGDAQPNDDAAKALQRRSLGRRGPVLM